MDIEYLKRFVMVGQTLNFRKAADFLFISQPTLSHSIKAIEEQLGVQLLKRTTKSVSLTDAGMDFYTAASEIISIYEKSVNAISARTRSDRLNIGYVGPALDDFVIPWMKAFNKSYPEVVLNITRYQGKEIRGVLSNRQVHLAFCFKEDVENVPGIDYFKTSREKYIMIVNSQNPLALKSSVSIDELAKLPLIICEPFTAGAYYKRVTDIFASKGLEANITQKCRLVSDIYRLVDMGLGVGIVSSAAARFYSDMDIALVDIEGTEYLEHDRVLAWSNDLPVPGKKFRKLVIEEGIHPKDGGFRIDS